MRALANALPGSLIRTIANAHMGQAGLIPLWFGETDQPTAPAITAAAQESLARGETFYGPNLGLPALRQALADHQAALFPTNAGFDNVAVTSSGLNAILLMLSALVDPGDEVIVVTPTWPNLLAIPTLLGATVREVPLAVVDGVFTLDLDAFFAAIGPRTRAVILNSPQNPTGWHMPADVMAAVVQALEARGIWLVADEVYARIVAEDVTPRSFLSHLDDDGHVVVINSFSKTWAMTGWRLGWITAPRRVVTALERLIEFNTSCAPTFVQRGGLAALGPAGAAFFEAQRARLTAARAALVEGLAGDDRIDVPETRATFYLFPRVRGLVDGVAFAHRCAAAGVGVAPGEAFGVTGAGHIRLCYARDPDEIAEAAQRLRAVIDAEIAD